MERGAAGATANDSVMLDTEGILEVEGLAVSFRTRRGDVQAVNGLSYSLRRGETFALIGESGSGKSVSALAVMGLLHGPRTKIFGRIRFGGRDMLTMKASERRRLRGTRVSMVFQDALAALNPVHTVGWQIAEMLRVHEGTPRDEARRRSIEMLERVRIPRAARRFHDYPHQLSGGMRQRVMIAMAIALNPDVLIADEPTTALDVTVQAQIMDLLMELREERGMSLLLITHDIAVASEAADRIGVMYAGRLVESGPTADLLGRPLHPYTEGLLQSTPPTEHSVAMLRSIPGEPPDAAALPPGCSFHPRCARARAACHTETPTEISLASERTTRCMFYEELAAGHVS